jgi:osmotically-inducible protein OsmY
MADAALERAEMVEGVKAVVDRVEVADGDRPDDAIRRDVRAALRVDPASDEPRLTVNVLDGTVTLLGEVGSFVEKKLAERAARSVRGVREVVDQLEVHYPGPRADGEILADVRGALRADRWVDEWLLEEEVDGGVVTLRGVQPTASAKRRAIDDAWVMGVRAVDARLLDVEPELRPERRRPPADYRYPDDAEIRRFVRAGLARDPRLSDRRIGVNVSEGIVTLRGLVGSMEARDAAAETAGTVRGVWEVENHLLVQGGRTDAELEWAAERALSRSAAIDEREITVDVRGGIATLRGRVDTPYAKSLAALVVQRIPGIRELRNDLAAPPRQAQRISDQALEQNVIAHLAAHPYVSPEEVEVRVSNGSVMLRGEVSDWRAEQEAVRAAYEAGATEVLDDIAVSHGGAGPSSAPAS